MCAMSRWDPFRQRSSMQRLMDRMMEDAFLSPEEWSQTFEMGLPLDVRENENEYIVEASIPGVNPDDLDITYDNNTLTIRGEMKSEEENKGETYHLRERRFGSFSRSLTLPSSIKADQIEANYKDGILTLTLPKAEEAKPRRIQIHGGGQSKMIEGKTKETGRKKT